MVLIFNFFETTFSYVVLGLIQPKGLQYTSNVFFMFFYAWN